MANCSTNILNGQRITWNLTTIAIGPYLTVDCEWKLHLVSDSHILLKLRRIWYSQVKSRPDIGYYWEEVTNVV